jgi:hypothetical protein
MIDFHPLHKSTCPVARQKNYATYSNIAYGMVFKGMSALVIERDQAGKSLHYYY